MDVAFAADKGGVGKTVLAYHTAVRFRQLGHDTALLDLDRSGNASEWALRGDPRYLDAYPLGSIEMLPQHDVRIWDTPAHPSSDMRRHLAEVADLIVVVSLTDFASQKAAAATYAAFSEAGAPVAVLLNAVHPSADWPSLVAAIAESGVQVLPVAVRRYSCYEHAQWDGRAVCDYPYPASDRAWSDIGQVCDRILSMIGDRHGRQAA